MTWPILGMLCFFCLNGPVLHFLVNSVRFGYARSPFPPFFSTVNTFCCQQMKHFCRVSTETLNQAHRSPLSSTSSICAPPARTRVILRPLGLSGGVPGLRACRSRVVKRLDRSVLQSGVPLSRSKRFTAESFKAVRPLSP